MFELKQQANGGNGGVREVVVGWFCTGSEMTELTCAVHGWFKQFSSVSKFFPQPPLTEPIHLMVDAIMESGSFAVKVCSNRAGNLESCAVTKRLIFMCRVTDAAIMASRERIAFVAGVHTGADDYGKRGLFPVP